MPVAQQMNTDRGRPLIRTENGRWGFEPTEEQAENGYRIGDEFTCGEAIELRVSSGQWLRGRFEHDGKDYYVLLGGISFYLRAGSWARRPV